MDESREVQVLPGLAHRSVISIGKLCDAGCEANWNQHTMAVTKDDKIVLPCTRNMITGLWRTTLQSLDRPTHQSNNNHQVNDKENSIKYLHASACSPLQDIWSKAVNRGYFNTWPRITEKDTNNMNKAEATNKGHLTHIRNNTRSTTTKKEIGD